jgi:hypothetical protein
MEKEKQRFVMRYFWMKNWDGERTHQKLVTTLGKDAYWVSQITIWLQKFRNGE